MKVLEKLIEEFLTVEGSGSGSGAGYGYGDGSRFR